MSAENKNNNSIENKKNKSLDKYWFKMNSELPEKCRCETMEVALEDIKFSKDSFTFWTDHNNCPNLLTTGFTPNLLESNVVRMVNDQSYLEFSKMSAVIAEDYIKDNKKGERTLKICSKYVNDKLADYIPDNGDE